jgi:hypothetical protein
VNTDSRESARREFFLSSGERVYLGDAEVEEILDILEDRVAEWLARKRSEMTEEEYNRMVIQFLEIVKLG